MAAMFVNESGEMCNLNRGPSIDAFYHISVYLGKRFQRRRLFRNHLIRNKNCLWWPSLLIDRDNMNNLYRGPSIDASYQVSIHLAQGFQRGILKCEKLTDDRRQVMAKDYCLWQDELTKGQTTTYKTYT